MKNVETLRYEIARTEQVLKQSAGRRVAYTALGMIAQANREQEMVDACSLDLVDLRAELATADHAELPWVKTSIDGSGRDRSGHYREQFREGAL